MGSLLHHQGALRGDDDGQVGHGKNQGIGHCLTAAVGVVFKVRVGRPVGLPIGVQGLVLLLERLKRACQSFRGVCLQDLKIGGVGVGVADQPFQLRGRFLQSPQVSVRVREAANQKVTVDGAVNQPGVYQITTSTTLLQAVAMARGPDKDYANLKRILVFRTIDGTRQAAVFNLLDIRSGKAPDPVILANDVIVVDGSNVKGAWREILRSLPGLAFFRTF